MAKPGITRREALAYGSFTAAAAALQEQLRAADLGEAELKKRMRGFCIDRPLRRPNESDRSAAQRSPVDAAILENSPSAVPVEDILHVRPAVGGGAAASAPVNRPQAAAVKAAAPRAPSSSKASAPARAAYLNRWDPGTTLEIFFIDASNSLADEVLRIARVWTEFANLRFQRTMARGNAHVKVAFDPNNGNWSYVGKLSRYPDPDDRDTTMNLGFRSVDDNYDRWVIRHEFGHAIGCIHEHQSPSVPFNFTEEVYRYFAAPPNNWTREMTFANLVKRYQSGELYKYGAFDKQSVMIYAIPRGTTNDPNFGTDINVELSSGDKEFAKLLYPGAAGPGGSQSDSAATKELKPDGSKVEGNVSAGGETTFEFTVPADSDNKSFSLVTYGTTQLLLRLYGPDDSSREVKAELRSEQGTPDLVNYVISKVLAKGKYVVKVAHVSKGGGGKFEISLNNKGYGGYLTTR